MELPARGFVFVEREELAIIFTMSTPHVRHYKGDSVGGRETSTVKHVAAEVSIQAKLI